MYDDMTDQVHEYLKEHPDHIVVSHDYFSDPEDYEPAVRECMERVFRLHNGVLTSVKRLNPKPFQMQFDSQERWTFDKFAYNREFVYDLEYGLVVVGFAPKTKTALYLFYYGMIDNLEYAVIADSEADAIRLLESRIGHQLNRPGHYTLDIEKCDIVDGVVLYQGT